MFSNAYSGPHQPELDPALTQPDPAAVASADSASMMMAHHQHQIGHKGLVDDPQYALPPISQDFARPSLSETRRPATSAGVLQHLITNQNQSNGASGSSVANESPEIGTHGGDAEYDAATDIGQADHAYSNLGGMINSMSHPHQAHTQAQQHQQQQHHQPHPQHQQHQMHFQYQNRPDLRAQNSGYAVALPPISHDFARPTTSETRRPATSAGILQRSMAPGTFGAMSAFSSLDAQRRASIGLGTINEHQTSVTPQPQQQAPLSGTTTAHQSSGYGMTPAQATYAHALEQHARRQSDLASSHNPTGYNGMFAHSIDGIDPNLTGMLNYMDITRRFSVPTLTTLPLNRPSSSADAAPSTGQSALTSARNMNSVRFNNPVKMETAGGVVDGYDTRPGSSGGPIFPTDYRIGLHGGFDPSTGTPNGFFPGTGDMTPQQQHQLYTLHSAASGVFPSAGPYSSAGMPDHRNGSYSSVSLDSTRHDSLTESSRNPSLPDIYLQNRRMSMDAVAAAAAASRNPSVADIYLHQHLQRRPSTGGSGIHSTTLADAAAHQMGLLGHTHEEPASGPVHKKRPRRKFDQIERLYLCGYEGCNKSYGTLNHLNAHVSMQKHGEKRRPEEFKEIRAAWRKRKKEEAKEVAEHHAVVHGGSHHPLDIERLEKDAYEAQGKWLAH
ncbi:hypothetical protein NliqN6_4779 [Naganishia liquefaciens]|uniref:C2H2-type domain-containing protein n=1 Tax=Naganishia liquefaciens TaxID=104408 RepID=A0A8H3YHN8_9TREE|nr:hypothetical protein NliqN6_4779 [Naganishia liquefaciens]